MLVTRMGNPSTSTGQGFREWELGAPLHCEEWRGGFVCHSRFARMV